MPEKHIVFFSEGDRTMRSLLGGKGAGLAEMTKIGLPVPPGFIITTATFRAYHERGGLSEEICAELRKAVGRLEEASGKRFGDMHRPLLLSVRSGAEFSMPGMMDTILNLGMNKQILAGLAEVTSARFALDCYRRLVEKYSEIVLKVPIYDLARIFDIAKERESVRHDYQMSSDALRAVIEAQLGLVLKVTGRAFPEDPWAQLFGAVAAVFDSWNNERAKIYRRINDIPDYLGTAVTIQSMVFGNTGDNSGTGVSFTRNPSTGERQLFGEFLQNAQGEDVVAGTRTPRPVLELKDLAPQAFDELNRISLLLEDHYLDMQDIEFTVEDAKLFVLQTRQAKRSPAAAVKVAMDMFASGHITATQVLERVTPEQVEQMLHRGVDYTGNPGILCKGLPASPGAAVGAVVFDSDSALRFTRTGRKVILVRPETSPDDIQGMAVSEGILTSRGGMTSHAAVVARGMGKPCVCGADDIRVNLAQKTLSIGPLQINEGDFITIDGSKGLVFAGIMPLVDATLSEDMWELLSMADGRARLGVRANADTAHDALLARRFGATGIGLCRTEHMFMQPERLSVVRAMIMSEDDETRRRLLKQLLPMQRTDFYNILRAMDGLPVTIRLLDPPLHEFLPHPEELKEAILSSKDHGERVRAERALRTANSLYETNPMLGHRGCRLGITSPGIYQMQTEAVAEALFDLLEEGLDPRPEIMIPLIGHHKELILVRRLVEEAWAAVAERRRGRYEVPIGTMIELPRACLTADAIARHADFFSFGTNDLTQTTFGFSRDDAEGKFLTAYLSQEILEANPFAVLDQVGVGKLMRMALEGGKEVNPSLKVGICGEHGGDPSSVAFCSRLGLDYVSCSPFRVPVARLAAGRATLSASSPQDK
ncbi:MAG TPA: pyruvate, phosphate dikinase [Bacillota bacterium]|nr:pyruvate, phosphate dikinase [Bacillota bacterium]